MAAQLVQAVVVSIDHVTIPTTPGLTVTFGSPVTPGNSVIVLIAGNDAPITYTANDALNGDYTQAIYNDYGGATWCCAIHYKHAIGQAFSNVRVWAEASHDYNKVAILEISGLQNALPQTGSIDNTGTSPSPCTDTGLSGTGLAVGVAMQSTERTIGAAGGFTLVSTALSNYVAQYAIGTFSNEVAAFTTDIASGGPAVMALFAESGGVAALSINLKEPVIGSTAF